MEIRKPKFRIGEYVYHVTPDSEVGVVLNIFYDYQFKSHCYKISLGFGQLVECYEEELTDEKVIIP